MKLISSQHATFIFEFKDNILLLELYSIHDKSLTYTLHISQPDKSESWQLQENDTIEIKIEKPTTERQVLDILNRDGFKLI
jgi:hypothetical protein